MGVVRLFDNVVIDWGTLRGPQTVRDALDIGPAPSHLPTPRLESIRGDEITSPAVLRALYRSVVARGLLLDSESNFLAFLSTAAYCTRVGRRPAALFVKLVKAGRYPATLEDEDGALAAWKSLRSSEHEGRSWLVLAMAARTPK